ncbi:UNKNOWN [Stylonychia lemnae]|uniref:Uncharacterized protein n=1 Tax=Stylonychia lemnae TaxID=5949 RepID=A0A077ZZU6_STYLE|nr:UNKNOWN [Stylonychia lemnae]|eukprot:CDW75147.1 UNKNOWN [Stylonychia lemnae]
MQESLPEISTSSNQIERASYAFLLGQTNVWFQGEQQRPFASNQAAQKDEITNDKFAAVSQSSAYSLSDDSASTDEGALQNNECTKLTQILKLQDGMFKFYDIDSRVGLNGSRSLWSFSCLHDEVNSRFFIWLGDLPIEKFTKSTFLNLTNFADKLSCKQVVLIMNRDHQQKNEYQRLLSVMDAQRVSKRGMDQLLTAARITDWIQLYALYRIELQ